MATCKCRLCHYKWESRKAHPKQCVRCKRMDWDKPNKRRK